MRRLLVAFVASLAIAVTSCDRPELVAAFEWVAFHPIQCEGNPWDAQEPSEQSLARFPIPELEVIADFFTAAGIEIRELGLVQEPWGVCLACGCPRGDLLVARVSVGDAMRLVGEFDFFFLFTTSPQPWLTAFPIQCGSNPWTEGGDPLEEAREVQRWAGGAGATLERAGFVYRNEGFGVCLACDCPRGDRLIVSVPSERDERVLRDLGFVRLFF